MRSPALFVHPEVRDALRQRAPVVALESAVITAGLPRTPVPATATLGLPLWNTAGPVNLELARLAERTVRAHGATPATVAMIDGTLHIGLDADALDRLAMDESAKKISAATIAHARGRGSSAGTTVAATLLACSLPDEGPIRVFATGGIGGVHRNWTASPDISADVRLLAQTQACVVCAGAKSILDLPATLEVLETLGVPVVGYETTWFPQFFDRAEGDLALTCSVSNVDELATLCVSHWDEFHQPTSVLACVPIAAEHAIDTRTIADAIARVDAEALRSGAGGADRTPYVLRALVAATGGRSLLANLALLSQNVAIAAKLAVRMADTDEA
ncbi:MAG: pseudouridine-5'-phosphate glycosidase [Phycisphaerales bacterium]|nr:pseudouridine-5'-phosphate glycosidase [Phycisphaerales bacterium]